MVNHGGSWRVMESHGGSCLREGSEGAHGGAGVAGPPSCALERPAVARTLQWTETARLAQGQGQGQWSVVSGKGQGQGQGQGQGEGQGESQS